MIQPHRRVVTPSRRSFLKAGVLAAAGSTVSSAGVAEALGLATEESTSSNGIANLRTNAAQPASPPWMKDLIIYEIATKGFTSPSGPASGTFNSLRAKLSYLQELGVTGIWLTGYSLCDSHHFYNIWNQYAVIEPDKFDPTLGTAGEFKAMIDEAHERGIKVCLDVITHGLMDYSPVIKAHPTWFRGSIFSMSEYDWMGGHTDFENWWVDIYTNFVTKYGVDGFRLDVMIYRPDLWERIRQNAAAAGHPIVIWEEGKSVIPGVTDFMQAENPISSGEDAIVNEILVNDLPGFYDRKFGKSGYYKVEITYADGTKSEGSTKGDGGLGMHLVGLTADKVSRRVGDVLPNITSGLLELPDGLLDVQLILENASPKPIANLVVRNDMGEEWGLQGGAWQTRPIFVESPASYQPLVVGPKVNIYIATLSWGSSVQLSCHDNGWEGHALGKSPYSAQGSRSMFGYSFLFSPMIPIFFAGEEFNATFHAEPGLSPNEYSDELAGKGRQYGDKDAGKGSWLYGTMLDWNELSEPAHRDMFNDVKKMMAIRKGYSETLAMCPGGKEPNLKAIQHEGDIEVPIPYMRWSEHRAILIAGNRNRDHDAHLKLHLDLSTISLGGHANYKVADLWSEETVRTYTEAELGNFACTVKRDGIAGGGISVFKIEPA